LHGDVEPPKLASSRDHLVAAVVGNEATSSTLELVGIQHALGQTTLKRGQQVSQGRDASTAFDLALGERSGLLVWDRWNKSKGHGTIETLAFDPESLAGGAEPTILDLQGDDAETPRVLSRPGGFWLIWVSHGAPEPSGAPETDATEAVEALESVVDVTPRRLKAVPLDQSGRPTAEPRWITSQRAHVLAYDVVSFGEGLLVAWRDDPTVLGAEAPKVHLAKIGADGSAVVDVLEDEQMAAGTPRLFLDAAVRSEPRVWLSVIGKSGKPRLGYFDAGGKLNGQLEELAGLGTHEPLALGGSRFLLGRPNGRALDLLVATCSPSTSSVAPAK
jgi:hypothetical protein